MATFEYPGFAYKQSQSPDAPWLVTFVAKAEQLLSWVGIPRRTEKGLVGFQRVDDVKRIEQARDYFNKATNQSPTSLIVGIHPPSSDDKSLVRLELHGEEDAPIRPCNTRADTRRKGGL